MDRAPILFGAFAVLAGVALGGLMVAYPEGLNPDWPLGIALIAPASFIIAGSHMVSSGLGYPRLSGALLGSIAAALWAIVNWAAFFTGHFHCRAVISFLGFIVSNNELSDSVCRDSLRWLVGGIDVLLAAAAVGVVWRKLRTARLYRRISS